MRPNYRFVNELLAIHHAKPITIVAITKVALPASHPQKGLVYKKVSTNGFVHINYEKHVQKMMGDPTFKAQHNWGTPVYSSVKTPLGKLSALLKHNGNYYVNFVERKKLSVEYIDINGRPVQFDPSCLNASNQVVKPRRYNLSNIIEMHIDGKKVI